MPTIEAKRGMDTQGCRICQEIRLAGAMACKVTGELCTLDELPHAGNCYVDKAILKRIQNNVCRKIVWIGKDAGLS